MMKYQFFEDKQLIDCKKTPQYVIDKLIKLGGVHVVDHGMKIAFCGVIIFDGCTYCFQPAKSSIKDIQLIGNLIKAIHSYHISVDSSLLAYDEEEQGEIIEDIALSDIFEIIDSYFNIGVLKKKKNRYSEKGRTNWSKTVNREFPFFTDNDVPIYLNLQKHPIAVYQDDLITSIHCEIILEIVQKFSWLDERFNFISEVLISEKILPYELECDQKIYLLKQRLYSTFISVEIKILQLLIKYLEKIKEKGSDDIVIGVKKFHYVWEFLLKHIFYNVDHRINSLLPIPQYHFVEQSKMPKGSAEKGMRIDLFIKEEKRCWVIDSKYYLATHIGNSPGWSDLVKQFFYIKAVKLIYPNMDEINNIFIFPGLNPALSKIQMTYRNELKKLDSLEKLVEDFVPIKCLYLDPNDVIKKFLKSEKVYIKDCIE